MSPPAIATTTKTLNTGAEIPVIALGTWESAPDDAYKAVLAALKDGYRHIDTAWIYGNEVPVGKAIREAGVPREEIFVTTKLWLDNFHDPAKGLETSLKNLGLDYVDLYLMHWPFALDENGKVDSTIDFVKGYANMQKLDKSKAKAIGVSNFDIKNLTTLLEAESTTTVPATNQVELHVKLPQQKLIDFCHSNGIVVEAYSPLGRGDLDNEVLESIAKKHNTGVANVVISWGIFRDTVVLPKSVTPARIKSNLDYIKLDADDINTINEIHIKEGTRRHCNFGKDKGVTVFHADEN